MVNGTIKSHEPRGITGNNLRQNPGGRRDLLIPTFVGYQAVENLLPDALLVLGGDALLPALLNCRQPMLEGVHVARRAAFAFQSCHFVLSQVSRFILCNRFHYSKVMAKSKNSLVIFCG